MTSNTCPHCGGTLNPNDNTCPYCGSRISGEAQSALNATKMLDQYEHKKTFIESEIADLQEEYNALKNTTQKKRIWALVLAIIFTMAGIGLFGEDSGDGVAGIIIGGGFFAIFMGGFSARKKKEARLAELQSRIEAKYGELNDLMSTR